VAGTGNWTHRTCRGGPVLHGLDERGLTNLVLLITRFRVAKEDMAALKQLRNLRVTLLFTFSGIHHAATYGRRPLRGKVQSSAVRMSLDVQGPWPPVRFYRESMASTGCQPDHPRV
jgi:hypothetical protein